MDRLGVGRLLRILRIRRNWRLTDLAARTGLSSTTLHRHEIGSITSLERLEIHARALDVRIDLRPVGRSAELPRTLDEEHAAIVNALAAAFQAHDERVEVEASFSEWGERGRIDLLAHAENRLVVGEIKTDLGDLQDLFGAMNAKARLGPSVAKHLGWPDAPVFWLLAVAATSRNRAIVKATPPSSVLSGNAGFAEPHRARRGTASCCGFQPGTLGRRQWLAGRRRVHIRRAISADGKLRR